MEEVPAGFDNAYKCECTCASGAITKELNVCVAGADNPNLTGNELTLGDIQNDCEIRVQQSFKNLTEACLHISQDDPVTACSCSVQATNSLTFDATCDPMAEDPADPPPAEPCPVAALNGDSDYFHCKEATHSGHNDAPVCLIGQQPLGAEIFPSKSSCAVSGTADITLDETAKTANVQGMVGFQGPPCPDASCAIGIDYRVDVDPIPFKSGVIADVTLQDVRASGVSDAASATLNDDGRGRFASGKIRSAGVGTAYVDKPGPWWDETTTGAYAGINIEPVDVLVDWVGHTCGLRGSLLGSTVEERSILDIEVDLHGHILNMPPQARAGADQVVECTAPDTPITLDGTASTDPEQNIVLWQWYQEDFNGPLVGSDPTVTLTQPVGVTRSYVLRTIDAFMQAATDATTVRVEDTTPPTFIPTAAPDTLTPSGSLVPVAVTLNRLEEKCGRDKHCQITKVTSSEPEVGPTDSTAPDWEITGDLKVKLRAEKAQPSNARVYTLTVTCTDNVGNRNDQTVAVVVP
jgi:hypothetical protein